MLLLILALLGAAVGTAAEGIPTLHAPPGGNGSVVLKGLATNYTGTLLTVYQCGNNNTEKWTVAWNGTGVEVTLTNASIAEYGNASAVVGYGSGSGNASFFFVNITGEGLNTTDLGHNCSNQPVFLNSWDPPTPTPTLEVFSTPNAPDVKTPEEPRPILHAPEGGNGTVVLKNLTEAGNSTVVVTQCSSSSRGWTVSFNGTEVTVTLTNASVEHTGNASITVGRQGPGSTGGNTGFSGITQQFYVNVTSENSNLTEPLNCSHLPIVLQTRDDLPPLVVSLSHPEAHSEGPVPGLELILFFLSILFIVIL